MRGPKNGCLNDAAIVQLFGDRFGGACHEFTRSEEKNSANMDSSPRTGKHMNKKIMILAAGLFTIFSPAVNAAVNIGVYDYNKTFTTATDLSYDEYFVSWVNFQPGSLTALCDSSKARNRWPIVTVEPWSNPVITPNSANLLSDVTSGPP